MSLIIRAVVPLLLAPAVLAGAACSGEQPVTTGAEAVSETSAPGETSTTETTVPGTLSDERIVTLARDAARGLGEPDPEEITWVRAPSRNAAAEVVRGRGSVVAMPEEDVPVVLISVRGRFAQPMPTPIGPGDERAEPIMRAALYLAVDEVRNEVMDVGVTDDIVDISVLGPVERAD